MYVFHPVIYKFDEISKFEVLLFVFFFQLRKLIQQKTDDQWNSLFLSFEEPKVNNNKYFATQKLEFCTASSSVVKKYVKKIVRNSQ